MKRWQGFGILALLTACSTPKHANYPFHDMSTPAENEPPVVATHVQLVQVMPIVAQVHAKVQWRDRCEQLEQIMQARQDDTFQVKIISNYGSKECPATESRFSNLIIPLETKDLKAGEYKLVVNNLNMPFVINMDHYAGGRISQQ